MIPTNKQQLISEITNNFSKLCSDIEKIPQNLVFKKELEGQIKDTKVSVHNLLSYLLGRGELVLKWDSYFKNIEKIELPETGYKWNELGKLAKKFYKDYESIEFQELKKKLKKNNADIIKMLEKHNNKDLYEKNWYGKWTFGRIIQFNTSSPYKNIRTRIRKILKLYI